MANRHARASRRRARGHGCVRARRYRGKFAEFAKFLLSKKELVSFRVRLGRVSPAFHKRFVLSRRRRGRRRVASRPGWDFVLLRFMANRGVRRRGRAPRAGAFVFPVASFFANRRRDCRVRRLGVGRKFVSRNRDGHARVRDVDSRVARVRFRSLHRIRLGQVRRQHAWQVRGPRRAVRGSAVGGWNTLVRPARSRRGG